VHVKEALAAAAGDKAASYLKGCGFRVLDRDWECDGETLSILAAERGTFVVVDLHVRAGTSPAAAPVHLAVPRRRLLRRLAARWLAAHGMRFDEIRVDVVAVRQQEGGFVIEHVRAVG
jgi:putative endonuclease